MEINDDLVLKWEPKIQKMVSNVFVVGMERDDIAQELRISLLKSAKAYDENRGVSFHTYLHTAMVNTLRTLITKAKRIPELRSLDSSYEGSNTVPLEILNALIDPSNYEQVIETNHLIESNNLTFKEQLFLKLKLEGLTMEEITEDIGESAYKVRQGLREKFSNFNDTYETN